MEGSGVCVCVCVRLLRSFCVFSQYNKEKDPNCLRLLVWALSEVAPATGGTESFLVGGVPFLYDGESCLFTSSGLLGEEVANCFRLQNWMMGFELVSEGSFCLFILAPKGMFSDPTPSR